MQLPLVARMVATMKTTKDAAWWKAYRERKRLKMAEPIPPEPVQVTIPAPAKDKATPLHPYLTNRLYLSYYVNDEHLRDKLRVDEKAMVV